MLSALIRERVAARPCLARQPIDQRRQTTNYKFKMENTNFRSDIDSSHHVQRPEHIENISGTTVSDLPPSYTEGSEFSTGSNISQPGSRDLSSGGGDFTSDSGVVSGGGRTETGQSEFTGSSDISRIVGDKNVRGPEGRNISGERTGFSDNYPTSGSNIPFSTESNVGSNTGFSNYPTSGTTGSNIPFSSGEQNFGSDQTVIGPTVINPSTGTAGYAVITTHTTDSPLGSNEPSSVSSNVPSSEGGNVIAHVKGVLPTSDGGQIAYEKTVRSDERNI